MPNAWSMPYYKYLMCASLRFSRKVICVSEATRRDLGTYYPIDEGRTRVIPEGVDQHFWKKPARGVMTRMVKKYQLDCPFILTVGARRPHKNHALLVNAFARIADRIPHDLIFVGPANSRFTDDTIDAVYSNNMQGRVRFLDWVPEVELPGFYRLTDLVVLPSIIEGFGLPALEAMASGTAVIAAGNTSYKEVIDDAGILFDPETPGQLSEEILKILSDPSERQRLAFAGQERARLFTWEEAARQVNTIYTEILD